MTKILEWLYVYRDYKKAKRKMERERKHDSDFFGKLSSLPVPSTQEELDYQEKLIREWGKGPKKDGDRDADS